MAGHNPTTNEKENEVLVESEYAALREEIAAQLAAIRTLEAGAG